MSAILLALAGYVIGMFPSALWMGRRIGCDPTSEGSGNPGASNMYRIGGRWAGLLVMVADMAKGAAPTLVTLLIWGRPAALAAWFGAVLGHVVPVVPKLRGGKGVATAGGGALVLEPIAGIVCLFVFFTVVGFTRTAAFGSLSIAVAYPALIAVLGWPGWQIATVVLVMAITVVRHRSNIVRMWRGTELEVQE